MLDLPTPDSAEVAALFPNRETREAYRFLYERRADPPTMREWLDHSAKVLGKANVHAQRRLREVRTHFTVATLRGGNGEWVYELKPKETPALTGAEPVSPARQVAVFAMKGRLCHMCGRGPQDGVKLTVAYRVPPAWGGPDTVDNLEPLCEEHDDGSREFSAAFERYAPALRAAIDLPTAWERIGTLLQVMRDHGMRVPAELLAVVARDENRGDPTRRLRDLRVVLGWDIRVHKSKAGRTVQVEYELVADAPWPPEGVKEAVNRYERDRKRRKAASA